MSAFVLMVPVQQAAKNNSEPRIVQLDIPDVTNAVDEKLPSAGIYFV